MYFKIIGPDGQTYVVQANDISMANARARSFFNSKFGATDMGQWNQQPQPMEAGEAESYLNNQPHLRIGDAAAGSQATQPTSGATPPTSGGGAFSGELTNAYTSEDPNVYGGIKGSFTRALAGRGINLGGSMGQHYNQMLDPYQTGFEARLNSGRGGTFDTGNQPFQTYVGSQQNPYDDILTAFRMGTGTQTMPGADLGNMKGYISPETAGEYGSANDLFQQALTGRVGGYAAGLLGRGLGNASDQYSAQPLADKGSQNYLNYLKNRLGLGGIQF